MALTLCVACGGDWAPSASAPTTRLTTPATAATIPVTTTEAPSTAATAATTTAPPTTAPPTTGAATTTVPAPTTTVAGRYAPTGMVDVAEVDPTIVISVGKASSDNVTGAPVPGYEANKAFLPPAAARALARVQRGLAARNLGLKVWDAYRPVRATQALVTWARSIGRSDLIGPYIASVSYHNSGQAVDLTLIDRTTGRELDMGTGYDDFTPAANTANATGAAAANRAILVEAMEAEGFENYAGEWWHFYYYQAGLPNLDDPVR